MRPTRAAAKAASERIAAGYRDEEQRQQRLQRKRERREDRHVVVHKTAAKKQKTKRCTTPDTPDEAPDVRMDDSRSPAKSSRPVTLNDITSFIFAKDADALTKSHAVLAPAMVSESDTGRLRPLEDFLKSVPPGCEEIARMRYVFQVARNMN